MQVNPCAFLFGVEGSDKGKLKSITPNQKVYSTTALLFFS